ncbi:type I polyketide synthase [Nonomuraea sp. NPDC049400]|uniref:type I polyketide synthase n=1 Tax=Nonomuraea sp. NPDC049400 TaxID=3364352 RepID=UPI0037AC77B4
MSDLDIAIIGMAGRFPGADDITAFWRNVLAAKECATSFSRDELLAAGLSPDLVGRQDFVGVRGVLADADRFDAAFFGYSPLEAQYIDPQQRIFLEVAWNAVENAGYAPDRFTEPVGVFASCSTNTYREVVLRAGRGDGDWKEGMLVGLGNQIDFLSTRISYKLNLTGPSMTVQTACSSSLVAVHLACQSLLAGECDVALAGGAAVRFPQVGGQLYTEGGIYSPDGRCRPYTADARGVFSGNGTAAVVLKRLDDAVAAGDWIHAVIKATAINNDGHDKVGYTAPSEAGQASAMRSALELAGVSPAEVAYVEGHGTGTPLGDSIEIAALRAVYDGADDGERSCALGSVKSNVGHLDAAAGVTGLIKAALAVRHGLIPPQPDAATPNPRLSGSPLYLTDTALPWPSRPGRRVAAVTALGLGGTNAHAVLEAPPVPSVPATERRPVGGHFLAPLSAASAESLTAMLDALPDDLEALRAEPLTAADVSATLLEGRSLRPHRAVVIGPDLEGIAASARTRSARHLVTRTSDEVDPPITFMYTGGGSQYQGMARRLLATDPVFAEHVSACRSSFMELTGADLITDVLDGGARLDDTVTGLCTIHMVQVALARSFIERGVRPAWQIGHSLGEYAAAVIGGSLSPTDGLRLVTRRSQLMAEVSGAMLSVQASPDVLRAGGHLDEVSLAAVNAADLCTVSGGEAAIAALAARLTAVGIENRRVAIGVPAHSTLLKPMVDRFRAELRGTTFAAPAIPWISNVTGLPITEGDLADPDYWVRHLLGTVRFAEGVRTLLDAGAATFVEVGPGHALSGFARAVAQDGAEGGHRAVTTIRSMRSSGDDADDGEVLAQAFAQLYCAGVSLDPRALYGGAAFRRTPLSGYRFARTRHWPVSSRPARSGLLADPVSWLTTPSWTRLPRLRQARALPGLRVVQTGGDLPGIAQVSGPEELRTVLGGDDGHARLVIGPDTDTVQVVRLVSSALDALGPDRLDVVLLTTQAAVVDDGDVIFPERAGAISALRVLGQEYPGLRWQVVDLSPRLPAETVLCEIAEAPDQSLRAVRPSGRWGAALVPAGIDGHCRPIRDFKDGGTYVFTGGLGRFSLHIARHLRRAYGARVILTSRRERADATLSLPPLTAAALDRLLAEPAGQVEIVHCDAEDEEALTGLFDGLGTVHGVFHAAAVTTGRSMRTLGAALSAADFETQLRPKLYGAMALDRALRGRGHDFCLLFSSNASTFGGPGLAAYAAANAAMEAFAEERWCRGDDRWLAAAWDGWRLDGEPERTVTSPLDRFALTGDEAVRMVETIVRHADTAVTVVSKADVRDRYEDWVVRVTADERPQPQEPARSPQVFSGELEPEVAELWKDVLGAAPNHPDESFFALGGHSLMGLRLISRIRERFGVPFDYATLVGNASVATMARWIAARVTSPSAEPKLSSKPSRTLSELLNMVQEGPST